MANNESLARYVRDHDAEAFAEIVEKYQALVFAVCRRRLRNSADVDDAVQETFLRLAKKASQLRTNLGGWLHSCAVNVSIDIERRRKPRHEHVSTGFDEFEAEGDPQAELAELREHLDAALLKLPLEDRELIIERFFVGKPQVQIALEAGVTPPVISNRLARAIDKLRVHLQAMGCTTLTAGGVAILAGAIATQHASAAVPPPLTANLMKIGLGKIASPLKVWSAARIFLGGGTTASILFIGWIIWREVTLTHAGYRTSETPPLSEAEPIPLRVPVKPELTATNDQNNLGEQILVARWYALLDDDAAKAIEVLGTPRNSESKLYHAMLFKSKDLRDALANTANRNGVLATGREVNFGKMWPWDKQMEIDPAFSIRLMVPTPRLRLTIDSPAPAEFERFNPPDQDCVRIVLNHPVLRSTFTEPPSQANVATQPAEQAIVYDGQVKTDEAIGFLGTLAGPSGTNYHLLVVWEAFRAQESQTSAFAGGASGIPTDWWIANGPEKMRMLADIAVVWAARAKHAPDSPPAAYSVILPNGGGVQLLGLSNPTKYNFCWWDGAGDPIDAPMGGAQLGKYGPRDTGLHYSAQVRGSTNEPETPLPSNDKRPRALEWQLFSAAVRTRGLLKFNLGEGPWKQIGELDLNRPLIVDGITYSLTTKTEVADDRFRVAFSRSIGNSDLMALTAVSNDGHEIGALGEQGISADETNTLRGSAAFTNLSFARVRTFHMWLRRGHVVTFSDFAQAPNERPPETVTPDQVAAAAAILKAAHPELNQLLQPRNNLAAPPLAERPEAPVSTPPGQIALPGHPSGIVCSPDGNWVFVALKLLASATSSPVDDAVVVLRKHGEQFGIERLISVPAGPFGMVMTHDGKTLIVATDTSVVLLDIGRMTSGAANPIDGEFSDGTDSAIYVNVTADDKTLFVSNEGDRSISVVDLARVKVHPGEKQAIIGKIPVGFGPIALALSPDGRWLYTTSEGAPPEWGWAKTEKPEGAPPAASTEMEAPGALVVVDVARAKIDPAHSVVSRVPAGDNPVRMTLSRDGRIAYVTARGSNAVLVFDAEKLILDPANSRLATVTVGSEPVPLCLVSDGKTLVVGNSNRMGPAQEDNTLSILDVGDNSPKIAMIGTIPAGRFPREMCLSRDGQTLFVSNFRSNSLQIIDTRDLPRAMK